MTHLQVRGLTVRKSSGEAVVDNLSFSVDSGERVGLIGESGSGKSVTSLAVMGLLDRGLTATGSIRLDGVEVVGASDGALRRLRGTAAAIVFQEPLTALDPLMRVGRQIAEPLARHQHLRGRGLKAAVGRALEHVALPDPRIARAWPHELSGGQRQRVAIAIALAGSPSLLIADEPTTALDVTVQNEILELLDRLVAQHHMGLLFISHDLAVVARMVEHVSVLQRGVPVEQGDVREVIARPQHPYTERLVASARVLDDTLDWGATRWRSVPQSGDGS